MKTGTVYQESYCQDYLRDVPDVLVAIQISRKEEIRISRAITRCKLKKDFLKILRM
jgi:hypothetical protein